ncbi:MAG: hypothetical protein C0621_02275 [Desulfuromonas sp.]|nr:MAG: hypothetical protein C0621_02275 [Desulfuromonas sp.]
MKQKVIVLGIDGGSFDIIDPLVKAGRLPHFAKVFNGGTRGPLTSTFPPMTFPAWNTFMTGVNPGRHGVFDFTEHIEGKYAVAFTNAQSRRSKTIWKLMSEMEKRVAVMGVPMTYPPEKINGVMVSGFDTPVGGMASASVFHPPEMHDELHAVTGGYEVSANIAQAIENQDQELALERIQATLKKKIDAALHVQQKEEWDFFMVLLGESDLVSHHFWRFHDPDSPLQPETVSETCRDAINRVYEQIDAALGTLLERLDDQTTLLIMSDHGFGGNGRRALYINRWLEEKGHLAFTREKLRRKLFVAAKNLGLKYLPQRLKIEIFRRMGGLADTTESMVRFAGIDWSQTRAYSEETPYFPAIWLNLAGREPGGTVPENDYDACVEALAQELRSWIDPQTGAPVFKAVYRKSEIYSGPHLDKAPDLLLDPNLIDGNSYLSRSSRSRPQGTCVDDITAKEMRSVLFQTKSGSHRRDGIFVGYGPLFQADVTLPEAHMVDLAPTIFSLMALPLPTEWEGKALHTHETEKTVEMELGCETEKKEYSEEEAKLVQQRLRDLGYM